MYSRIGAIALGGLPIAITVSPTPTSEEFPKSSGLRGLLVFCETCRALTVKIQKALSTKVYGGAILGRVGEGTA